MHSSAWLAVAAFSLYGSALSAPATHSSPNLKPELRCCSENVLARNDLSSLVPRQPENPIIVQHTSNVVWHVTRSTVKHPIRVSLLRGLLLLIYEEAASKVFDEQQEIPEYLHFHHVVGNDDLQLQLLINTPAAWERRITWLDLRQQMLNLMEITDQTPGDHLALLPFGTVYTIPGPIDGKTIPFACFWIVYRNLQDDQGKRNERSSSPLLQGPNRLPARARHDRSPLMPRRPPIIVQRTSNFEWHVFRALNTEPVPVALLRAFLLQTYTLAASHVLDVDQYLPREVDFRRRADNGVVLYLHVSIESNRARSLTWLDLRQQMLNLMEITDQVAGDHLAWTYTGTIRALPQVEESAVPSGWFGFSYETP